MLSAIQAYCHTAVWVSSDTGRPVQRKLACRKYTLPGMHMWSPAAESRGALLMPMGTMEDTKDKGWTWILQAPMADVQRAGVHFDPNARTAKAIQGDAVSSSALEVRVSLARAA